MNLGPFLIYFLGLSIDMQVQELIRTKITKIEDGFMCLICGKALRRVASAKRHLKDIHLNVTETFRCPVCKNLYSNRNNFNSHIVKRHNMKGVQFDLFRVSGNEAADFMQL